jgi:hypothetical protein
MIEYSCEVWRRECDRVSWHKNEAFRRGPSKKPSRTFQASFVITQCSLGGVLFGSARSLTLILKCRNVEDWK